MKTKLLFTIVISALLFPIFADFSFAQGTFYDKYQRVTSGFVDKNPSFDVKRITSYGSSYISFLTFERWANANTSNICIKKFGYDSAYGPVKYITNDNNIINRNPQLAYKHNYGPDSIQNAMLVWERVENSRVNIYGATYYNGIWSNPYPIDTGSGIKKSPSLSFNTAANNNFLYSVVYEKDGDIIFKNYESVLNQVWNNISLTDSITDVCRNPKVSATVGYNLIYVVYERQKANSDFAIYYKRANTSLVFTGDTIATRGNNRNPNFVNNFGSVNVAYESNFSGKWGIYEYAFAAANQPSTLVQSPLFNYRNLTNYLYPIITNNPNYNAMLTSYIIQRPSITKIFSTVSLNFPMDSITVGDSSCKSVLTINNGLTRNNTWTIRVWMVFDKDSAGYSTLDARGKLVVVSSINQISTIIPDKYSLSQNYPNPFNPATNIKFSIIKTEHIKLAVYDITGREVQTLVNETVMPGTYETSFDGSLLTSGIYFYKLITNDYTETKRMVLIK